MRRSTPPLSERAELIAFFGGLCLLLSTLEYLIPKPIPFLRIGLANLPILLALRTFPFPALLLLILLKVLGQGLVTGTLFSYVFIFSASGSLASGLAMIGCLRLFGRRISLVGISVFGALASNLTQVFLAAALVFGKAGWLIAPPFLAVGTASGLLLGLFGRSFEGSSSWLKEAGRSMGPAGKGLVAKGELRPEPQPPNRPTVVISASHAFLAGIALLPAFLFQERLEVRAIQAAVFMALSLASGKRLRLPLHLVSAIVIIAANLLAPLGMVLLVLGPFPVTAGALRLGALKATTLTGLVFLSRFAVRSGLKLPGRLGGLLARTTYFFERMLEKEKPFDRREPLRSLDRFLWSLYRPGGGGGPDSSAAGGAAHGTATEAGPVRTSAAGWLLLIALVAGNWVALLLPAAAHPL